MAIKSEKPRRVVTQRLEPVELDGKNIKTLISELQELLIENYDKGPLISSVEEGYRGEEEWVKGKLIFIFKRLENDHEYQRRMEMLEFSEKRERETYERLKKKFEG